MFILQHRVSEVLVKSFYRCFYKGQFKTKNINLNKDIINLDKIIIILYKIIIHVKLLLSYIKLFQFLKYFKKLLSYSILNVPLPKV